MQPDAIAGGRGMDRGPEKERRGDLRHVVRASAKCRLLADEAAEIRQGRVRDISSLGVGLLLPARLQAGQLLDIVLENGAGAWVGSMRARVIHVDEAEQGQWLIGCAFISELDNAELGLFQAARIKPAANDGRRWVRFPCDVETVCYTCETAPGERCRAQIVNVSAGGLGLLLPCEFAQGTILRLELPTAMAQRARLLLIRVVHCVERDNGGWLLGCEFADQLGAAKIRAMLGNDA